MIFLFQLSDLYFFVTSNSPMCFIVNIKDAKSKLFIRRVFSQLRPRVAYTHYFVGFSLFVSFFFRSADDIFRPSRIPRLKNNCKNIKEFFKLKKLNCLFSFLCPSRNFLLLWDRPARNAIFFSIILA